MAERLNPFTVLDYVRDQLMQGPDKEAMTAITNSREEIESKQEIINHIVQILRDLYQGQNEIEIHTETSLELDEDNGVVEEDANICEELSSSQSSSSSAYFPSPEKRPREEHDKISWEQKLAAHKFAKQPSTNKWRAFSSLKNRFSWLKSNYQVRSIYKQVESVKMDRESGIKKLKNCLYEKFLEARENNLIVHVNHLKAWAHQTSINICLEQTDFTPRFISRFNEEYGIVSRRITHYSSKSRKLAKQQREQLAKEFVNKVNSCIPSFAPEFVVNFDQSGFQKELIGNRTLSLYGEKQTYAMVQSKNMTTHSYTIMPMISLSGKIYSPLFICLQEPVLPLSSAVMAAMFTSQNIVVSYNSSGKFTKHTLKEFATSVISSNLGQRNLILHDSWSGFKNQDLMSAPIRERYPEAVLQYFTIPDGTTDFIQPLDRFGFLQWKSYAKKFSEHVRIYCPTINVFKRNNILKLQALIHNQFSSPRFVTMWQYSFYLAGYLATKPSFVNPIDFAFGDVTGTCNEDDCHSFIFVRCSWCKLKLCFHHFFDASDDTSNSKPHLCNIFVP